MILKRIHKNVVYSVGLNIDRAFAHPQRPLHQQYEWIVVDKLNDFIFLNSQNRIEMVEYMFNNLRIFKLSALHENNFTVQNNKIKINFIFFFRNLCSNFQNYYDDL